MTTVALLSLSSNMGEREKQMTNQLVASHLDAVKESILKMEVLEQKTFSRG